MPSSTVESHGHVPAKHHDLYFCPWQAKPKIGIHDVQSGKISWCQSYNIFLLGQVQSWAAGFKEFKVLLGKFTRITMPVPNLRFLSIQWEVSPTPWSLSAGWVNQYVIPISLANIGWRICLIGVCWKLFAAAVIGFTYLETKGLSLEQIDKRFEGVPREEVYNGVKPISEAELGRNHTKIPIEIHETTKE